MALKTDDIQVWNPATIFCELSKGTDILTFYPVPSAGNKGSIVAALTKDLSMAPGSIHAMCVNHESIGVFAGEPNDVASLIVLLGAYPYNELIYFAHYSDGVLVEENIPEEVR
jgi:hypothetical protein